MKLDPPDSKVFYVPEEFYDHMRELTEDEKSLYLVLCRFTAAQEKPTWSASLLKEYASMTDLSKEAILEARTRLVNRGLLPREASGLPYVT